MYIDLHDVTIDLIMRLHLGDNNDHIDTGWLPQMLAGILKAWKLPAKPLS